jgi:ESS family glutamate:Na+ symporter
MSSNRWLDKRSCANCRRVTRSDCDMIARRYGVQLFQFDTTLQSPLMIAFFTTRFRSVLLLRVAVFRLLFFAIATVFAILQNVIGALIAIPFD